MPSLAEQLPGWYNAIKPRERLTVSDWADRNRVLNQRSAAEPGRWRTARTPYLQAIMDDLSQDSSVQRVTFMKGAQIGGTEAGNNWIGYQIDHAPGPAMVVQPTVDMGKRWSKQRLAPMIEDMDCLADKVKESRSRDSGNTTMSKEYPGGITIVSGANSASGLRSMPVKNLMLDEIDAYPYDVDGEGDPVELAINRTKTFARKKILLISTPTTKGMSRIERSYNEGDQRRFYVPCPHCEEKQPLEFKNLQWLKDDDGQHRPETAEYACAHCGGLIPEHHKTWMLENGQWVAENTANISHHSYHISSLYSPLGWESWAAIADKFIKSKNDVSLLKTFTNTIEGLPFEEQGDKVDRHALEERADDKPVRVVPLGYLALTAGVDIQDNRIEAVTWAHSMTSHRPIDYHVIWGSPDENETWQQLDEYLRATFTHEAGTELAISAAAIDSGGHHTQRVYDFTRLRKRRHIIAVKGSSQRGKPILGKPSVVDVNIKGKAIKNGAEVWMVGTDTAKEQIYSWLKLTDQDADGYVSFPAGLPETFYQQLTAEKLATRYHKGFPVQEWVKPAGARNEVLDCTVYALAAYRLAQFHAWRPSQWRDLENRVQPPTGDLFAQQSDQDRNEETEKVIKTVKPRKASRGRKPRRGGGFVGAGMSGGVL